MKAFSYKARTAAGTIVDGLLEANTREEAIERLRADGMIVSSIRETPEHEHDIDLKLGGKKAKEKDLAILCNQFAIILEAGMPIVRTMELVAAQCESKTLKEILEAVADDVAAGYPLADSFAKHGEGLPTTFIETIRAGEASGGLDSAFRRLSKYYEKQSKTKQKVQSALVYPSFVIVVAVIVVAVIMILAVPTFKSTFEGMGQELPFMTQLLIGMSDFLTQYWWVIAGIIVAGGIAFHFALKNEAFHLAWSRLGVSTVPKWPQIIRRINRMSNSAQFASTMSTMIAAGLPVIQATEVTSRVLKNYWMGHQLAACQTDLEAGKTLYSCLVNTGAFPDLVCEMTSVGEQTGQLEHTLDVLSDYYDNEVETATANALAVLEPAIIVFLAGFVVVVLLAVYMPLFGMYGAMGS